MCTLFKNYSLKLKGISNIHLKRFRCGKSSFGQVLKQDSAKEKVNTN